jgi:hypothetical protein
MDHVLSGTLAQPVCPTCTNPDTVAWSACPGCGRPRVIRSPRCERCNLLAGLVDLLSGGSGTVRPDLQPLYDSLAGHERPATLLRWLARPHVQASLADLGSGRLPAEHAALDALPPGKRVEHLRAMLVSVGVLPARDEHLARLDRWITDTISAHPQAQLLRRYAVWHVLRRLRARNPDGLTAGQATHARANVNAAIALLDWMAARNLTLDTAGQGDLDHWLAGPSAHRVAAGHFARWARRQRMTTLRYPATAWHGPARALDTEARWDQTHRLLHDDTLPLPDRVAGLLVLLYAQHVTTLTGLSVDHLIIDADGVALRLGRAPIELPEPLAGLVLSLAASRHGHAALTDRGTSPWLFPGGRPGTPIGASQLAHRIRAVGVHAGQGRSTAMFALAGQLPAALLAQMLGTHISAAVKWQRASAGDWTAYAADYAKRDPHPVPGLGYSETSSI